MHSEGRLSALVVAAVVACVIGVSVRRWGAGGVVVVAGALLTFDAAVRLGVAWSDRTLTKKWRATSRLRRLAANATVEYFSSVLGVPVMVTAEDDGSGSAVYVHDYFYVHVLHDRTRTVEAYSVTSRSTRFRPRVPFPNGGNYWGNRRHRVRATLNQTRFSAVVEPPVAVYGTVGARRFWYAEAFYFGNPANYQTVILSLNDAGAGRERYLSDIDLNEAANSGWLSTGDAQTFRHNARPNTYTVTRPMLSIDDAAALTDFGVDLDQVRVLR